MICIVCEAKLEGKRRKFCSKKCCDRAWQMDNREKINKDSLAKTKANNYKWEKTPEQRRIRYIKRKTRWQSPIPKNKKCQICLDNDAIERHHTTNPITTTDFIFVCHPCHIVADRERRKRKKEVNSYVRRTKKSENSSNRHN